MLLHQHNDGSSGMLYLKTNKEILENETQRFI